MAYPAGVTTCTMTFGQGYDSQGNVAQITGTVVFDRKIVHASTGKTIYPVAAAVSDNGTGTLSFEFPHVNQAGLNDGNGNAVTGWMGILTGQVRFSGGGVAQFRKPLQPMVGDTVIDLDLVPDDAPVIPAVSVEHERLTSWAGLTGAITPEQAADALEGLVGSTVEGPAADAVMRITTAGAADVTSTTDYLNAMFSLSGVPGVADWFGTGRIRVRGNSTAQQPKKPYKVKLDQSAPWMGLPADKDWALLANALDHSHTNTALAFDIGDKASGQPWVPRYGFARVYLNGQYQGFYQVAESVKIDSDRVAVTKATGTTGLPLTGAYLLEIAEGEGTFTTTHDGLPILMDDPEDVTPAHKTYIQGHLDAFETMLYGSGFADPVTGYAAWIDAASFADWYLVQELFLNTDSDFFKSCKFYKQRDTSADAAGRGKIVMGPLWDFDLALGNGAAPHHVGQTDNSLSPTSYYTRPMATWIQRLYDAPTFRALIGQRWTALKDAITAAGGINAIVDRATARVANHVPEDAEKWDYVSDWSSWATAHKAFLNTRVAFFDSKITEQISTPGTPGTPVATAGEGQVSVAFPAPSNVGNPTLTAYTVTASTGQTAVGSASPITVTGLPGGTPVTFTVKAKNFYGESAASAVSNEVTPTGQAVEFDPTSISGMQLWLDASQITGLSNGAAVPTWADMSGGAGTDATQATAGRRPTYKASTAAYNGKPTVHFDGGDDELTGTAFAMPTGGTLMMVLRRENYNEECAFSVRVNADGGLRFLEMVLGEGLLYRSGSNTTSVGGGNFGPDGAGLRIVTGTHSVTDNIARVYGNGVLVGSSSQAAPLPNAYPYAIGNIHDNGDGTSFGGDIAEVLAWDRMLSDAERQQVDTYLKAKYGIA